MKKEEQPFKFKRVLLIDDNDIDNFINERMITTSNFAQAVVVKTTAEAGLDYLKKISDASLLPEVIFLDLNMPGIDGFGFLVNYENLPDALKKFCKVIVLSSSISPEDINRASTNPHVLKYINKPLSDKYLNAINF